MDSNTFKKEVLQMVKDKKQQEASPGLTEMQMKQLDAEVFSHIETLFPSDNTQETLLRSNEKTPQISTTEKLKGFLTNIFDVKPLQLAGGALAAISFLAVGIITYQGSGQSDSGLLDIPSSLTTAGLEKHVQNTSTLSAKAIVTDTPSQRRSAFLTGITQAAVELVDDTRAGTIASNYHQLITGSAPATPDTALQLLSTNIDSFSELESTRSWMIEGHAVELVHLAATRAMTDMNTNILDDAIDFYRQITPDLTADNTQSIPEQYLSDRSALLNTSRSTVATPSQIQNIIDSTQQMILIIR